jgi:hypothetical protein
MCETPKSPKGDLLVLSPCLSEILITFRVSENDEWRYEVDVVGIKFIKDLQNRSFSSRRRRWSLPACRDEAAE